MLARVDGSQPDNVGSVITGRSRLQNGGERYYTMLACTNCGEPFIEGWIRNGVLETTSERQQQDRCEFGGAEVEGLATRFERCRLLRDFEGGLEAG